VDDQSGLSLILPEPSQKSLTEYYNYIVLLFEPIGADQSIAKFCQLAINSSCSSTFSTTKNGDDYQNEKNHQNQLVLNLWVKLFKALINLALWDDAYQALISTPSIERLVFFAFLFSRLLLTDGKLVFLFFWGSQNDCLRTLVSHMCEANEVDKLLRFSWTGLQIEFEKTISFRARNSDPLGLPNYFSILYAYHINRADYRSGKYFSCPLNCVLKVEDLLNQNSFL
jgi:nuclear pore complex protein Nup160